MQNGPSQGPREAAVPNAITAIVRTPLHEAAATGDQLLLEKILATGADRNHKDSKHGNTPLHEAAWRGYSKCVKALCALPKLSKEAAKSKQIKNAIAQTQGSLHSALLGTRNIGGFSALHLAAQNGHNQSCREILLAGGDPNVQNNYGDTPLHTACRYGHAGATRILLSAKADPLRVNLNGDSALHIACAMGRRKLTRILLAAGSSLKIQNAQNEAARDIAVRKKLNEILEILDSPVDETQRDRSSSSSRQKDRKEQLHPKGKDGVPKTPKHGKYDVNPKNWSPYGCHYFPDPRSFPSPRLETLPKEPLGTGEQYFLDLAGNIRKGPVGVGNTCYCGPFFRHIEERISRNKKSLKKYVHKATEKLDNKVQALALKTDDQIELINRKMLADRIRCDGQRQHLEQWLKRGDRMRATVAPHTTKSHKDQTNTNTLTRCRSLEMLDNNGFVESMKCTTPGMSRSFNLLDSHQVIVHRDACHNDSDEHGHDDSDRNHSYLMDSDKEWQYHGSSKPASSDKDKISSVGDKHRRNSSEKDRNSLEDKSDSELSKRIKYMERQKGYSVAARLEELLCKTNEIIEMERTARRKSNEAFSMLAPEKEKSSRRPSKQSGSDLRVSSSSRSSGAGLSGSGGYESSLVNKFRQSSLMSNPKFDDDDHADNSSFKIAQEMEKITSSLLGREDPQHHNIQGSSDNGPVSPEIAKEHSSKKEQKSAREQEQELSSVLSEGSHRSYGMPEYPNHNRNGSYNGKIKSFRTDLNGYMSSSSKSGNSPGMFSRNSEIMSSGNAGKESSAEATQSVNVMGSFGGFYQNSSFEDELSLSVNTLNVDGARRSVYHHEASVALDVDDRCELSEMANMKELNELKSRILNGAHWRSQMRKNGHEKEAVSEGNDENVTEIHLTPKIEVVENIVSKSAPKLPIRSKVHDLVAKIQGSKNITNSEAPSYLIRKNTTAVDEDIDIDDDDEQGDESESSDEDEDDDIDFSHDVVDTVERFGPDAGNAAAPLKSAEFLYDAFRSQRQVPSIVNPKPLQFKAYAMNGEETTVAPSQLNVSHPISPYAQQPVIDTRYLIPKDAYFHELPNRSRPGPITDKLSELAFPQRLNGTNGPSALHGMDPRPSILQPHQPSYHVMGHNQSVDSRTPYIQHVTQLPQREKLLSNRKLFSAPSSVQAPHYKPFGAYAPSVLGGPFPVAMPSMSTHFINIEQEQIERDANNDSGYSTRINGSLNGPSPSLSGQTDPDLGAMEPIATRNDVYRGTVQPTVNSNKLDRYYMTNIGASSLV